MKNGGSLKLTATVEPSNAFDKTVKWESLNPDIATVDQDGNVKALKVGDAKIKVSLKNNASKKDTITIKIKSNASSFTNYIYLYNDNKTVNEQKISELNKWLTETELKTVIHRDGSTQQEGPYDTWWSAGNNWFTDNGYKFQCTWYVYGRANQYLSSNGTKYKSWPGTKDNAKKWYYSGTEGGSKYFQCGSTPKANSIAVFGGNEYGHVAYVEAVDTVNKMVYISHAGGGKRWFGVEKYSYEDMKTLFGLTLYGYVYLDEPLN